MSPNRESSPPPKKQNTGDNGSNKRCTCWSCSMKGKPIDPDRNWSIRFPGETKEFHDTLMRLLDESLEDIGYTSMEFNPYSKIRPTPREPAAIIDASPSEVEDFASTDSSDDMLVKGLEEREESTRQDHGEDSNQPQDVTRVGGSTPRSD